VLRVIDATTLRNTGAEKLAAGNTTYSTRE
jgi:hypothetical protein